MRRRILAFLVGVFCGLLLAPWLLFSNSIFAKWWLHYLEHIVMPFFR